MKRRSLKLHLVVSREFELEIELEHGNPNINSQDPGTQLDLDISGEP